MFLRMLGQRDTQYSQFDSERRINGNARLLEGGNTLNRPFPLFVTWGRLTMGSVSGRSISELSHECSAHARTDTESAALSAQEGPGTMRTTRPRAPTLRGSCRARRAKQASAWAQASTAVSTALRAPGLLRALGWGALCSPGQEWWGKQQWTWVASMQHWAVCTSGSLTNVS